MTALSLRLTNEDVSLHSEVLGGAGTRTVVLLHGWMSAGTVWRRPAAALAARGYRVVALDLRGHGQSSRPVEGYTLPDYASDLDPVLDQLARGRPVHLAGWDLGATIAMYYAASRVGQAASLIVLAGTPRLVACQDWPHGMAAEAMAALLAGLEQNFGAASEAFVAAQFASRSPQLVRTATRLAARVGRRVAVDAGEAASATDLRAVVPQVNCPTLVVHGRSDVLCPPAAGRWLADNLPAARPAVLISQAGHYLPLSHPREVSKHMIDFLDTI
ncbi:MAG: alpha/beta fold hydrolase [Mycobacteriales bacterium]